MKRNIITIDEQKCNGCGLCVSACEEGALKLVNGKARLVSESYCDGLGACLPECPTGAITIEEREADPFDEQAVKEHLQQKAACQDADHPGALACGCAGTQSRIIDKDEPVVVAQAAVAGPGSQLRQWPCQIKLVPAGAPYLDSAHLLIAADCTAYAYAGIHQDFMRNKITLIGCPKLDGTDYSVKLTAILQQHRIKSITVLKMEVPCCAGLVEAVKAALINSGKMIPWQVVTVSVEGKIVEE
ncbi:MAG TPA: 4Fe-4S binding protein [Firmicutes bacterium]|nr:4Fe-4S binding protein [Bacillota bacterium]